MAFFEHGYALVVGMGGDLPGTAADAKGLAGLFQDEARCAYPSEQVHLLTAENATRSDILEKLKVLQAIRDPQATVVVYFSGHGYRVSASVGEFYYLMPNGYDSSRLHETAISGAEFAAQLRLIPAQRLLLLLDCCHAGGVGKPESSGMRFAKAAVPPEAQSLMAEGRGRVLIASSQEDELSFAGRPYSAFTLAMMEALCGRGVSGHDGLVRVADLALHARQVVPGRTANRQHPILHFESADNFALAYYAGGEAQPKALPFTSSPEIEPQPGAWRGIKITQQTAIGDGNVQLNLGDLSGSTLSINIQPSGSKDGETKASE